MNLSDKDITNFKTLYRSEFGMEISREDALEKGIKLLGLMSVVYKPIIEEGPGQPNKLSVGPT